MWNVLISAKKCLCFTDVVVTSFNEETRRSDTTATKTVTGLQEDTTPVEGGGGGGELGWDLHIEYVILLIIWI